MRDHDARFIKAVIEHSCLAVEAGCMPFGAVLVDESGNILVEAQNAGAAAKKRGGAGDVTRHAEMELIRKATTQLTNDKRKNCTVYTSTGPCVMCVGAIYWGGISHAIYGCPSLQLEAQLSGPGGFDIDVRKLYGMGRSGTRKMEVEGPLLAKEASQVHAESGIWMTCEEFLKNKALRADQQDIEVERSL
jgi:tRNA(Arg) A34 adenosine deaminase TadA